MRLLAFILPAALLVACNPGGPNYITTSSQAAAQLTVAATGTADVSPDQAIVSAGVVSQGKSAREAMMANATLMTAVFDELTAAGIDRKNVTTSQLSLQPQYNYQDRRAPKIERYESRNTVTVKSDDLDQVGAMLDALVRAGVNNINQVQFTVKDPKSARDTARDNAIAEAREKAKAMADAAGVKLGPLMSLNETSGSRPMPVPMMAMRAEADFGGATTPMSAGEQTLSVTVNMSYKIEE